MEKIIKLNYYDNVLKKSSTLEFSSTLIKEEFTKESLFVINVEGESMQPLILDKSLVIVSLSFERIKNNSIYIIEYKQKTWIKRAKVSKDNINFISINEDFSHIIFKEKEVRVLAKALLTFTSL